MKISVVLLTYNGGDKLREVVAALSAQDLAGQVEYVAVDSGSTDGTCESLTAAGFHLYHVDKKHFAYGPTREYAFHCSTGEVIITQSQDVVPMDRTYLQAMTGPILKGEADVVQGLTAVPPEDERVFLWDRWGGMYFTGEGCAFMKAYGDIGLSCSCLAISRRAWEATGFDGSPYAEDKLIQKRLVEKGFRIVSTASPVAWHGHAYSLSSLVKRCLNEGIGWRYAGVCYSLGSCLRDLSVGFAKHLPKWARAVLSGRVNGLASLLFFQIRPVCVWVGNRILKRVVL